jgi:hypothetical protein
VVSVSTPSASTEHHAATASNVLLLAPSFLHHEDVACAGLFGPTVDEHVRAVFVACGQSAKQRLAVWDDHVGDRTAERVVVDVEMLTRSSSASPSTDALDATRLETVSDPADLVNLGATIDGLLADPTSDATRRVLCVHSLTDLIGTADTRNVYSFLEVLTKTVDRVGAFAHYHMDPTAHDPETIRTFEQLFDDTVDVRDGGRDQ